MVGGRSFQPTAQPLVALVAEFLLPGGWLGGWGWRGRREPIPEVTPRSWTPDPTSEGYMNRYDARFKLQVAKEACKTSTSIKAI
ncbi:hypothetical protein GUR46_17750, partial [Stenotrophomonas maltophilia]|nr:hypothetical protein [Stenotrophomonas maltophilia]MCF3534600.1 hypothetical protein [Stenotrophomonas maltophilia]